MLRSDAMVENAEALTRAATELRARADDIRGTVRRLLPSLGPDVWCGRRAARLAEDLDTHHRVLAHVADRIDDAAAVLERRAQSASATVA